MNQTSSEFVNHTSTSQFSYSLGVTLAKTNVAQITHQFEQHFTQIISESDSGAAALLAMTQKLGELFLVDSCLIGIGTHPCIQINHTHWQPEQPVSWSHNGSVLNLLQHPAISWQQAGSSPLAIADVRAFFRDHAHDRYLLESWEHSHLDDWYLTHTGAVLAIATSYQKQPNGVVVLVRSKPYAWTDLEVQLLQRLSSHIAIAISHMQLELRLQQQLRHQELIDRLSEGIHHSWDVQRVLDTAVAGLVDALNVSRGFALLLKYADPMLRSRHPDWVAKARAIVESEFPRICEVPQRSIAIYPDQAEEWTVGTWLEQSFAVSGCVVCQTIFAEPSAPLIVGPVGATPADISTLVIEGCNIAPIFNAAVMATTVLVPLENQGTVLGCLVLQQQHPYVWKADDIALARLVAVQVSTAIIQTRALRRVQALVKERTAQLQRSLDVQAKLYEKSRQQVTQLQQMNELMSDFLSTVSHELRTPLTSMTIAIRMLREAPLSPTQQQRYLDILDRQCTQETNLINDLLALQQLETKAISIRLQPLDVRYLIRDVAHVFADGWTQKNLTLMLELPDDPLHIYTDLESLNRILTELLTNAGKYAVGHSTIQLTVEKQPHPQDQMVVSVTNIGLGILPEDLPYIFDRFRRGQGVTQQAIPGTGLGLTLVKGLVDHLNGTIESRSIPLDGSSHWETCFTLTLPISAKGVSC